MLFVVGRGVGSSTGCGGWIMDGGRYLYDDFPFLPNQLTFWFTITHDHSSILVRFSVAHTRSLLISSNTGACVCLVPSLSSGRLIAALYRMKDLLEKDRLPIKANHAQRDERTNMYVLSTRRFHVFSVRIATRQTSTN